MMRYNAKKIVSGTAGKNRSGRWMIQKISKHSKIGGVTVKEILDGR